MRYTMYSGKYGFQIFAAFINIHFIYRKGLKMEILTSVLLGIGTVFFGLICLIILIQAMHAILARFTPAEQPKPKAAPAPAPKAEPEIDHNTLVAIASAAVAEQLGKDVDAIRIRSIRKL